MTDCIFSTAGRTAIGWIYSFVRVLLCTAVIVLGFATPATANDARRQATDRLFAAVFANDMVEVQLSVAAGAELEYENDRQQRAVDLAADHGYFRIVHYLLGILNERRSQASAARFLPPATPVLEPVVGTSTDAVETSSQAVITPESFPSVTHPAVAVQQPLSDADVEAPEPLSPPDPETLPADSLPSLAVAFKSTYLQQVNNAFAAAIKQQLQTVETPKAPIKPIAPTTTKTPKPEPLSTEPGGIAAIEVQETVSASAGPGFFDRIIDVFSAGEERGVAEALEATVKPTEAAPDGQAAESENTGIEPTPVLEAKPEAPQTAHALAPVVAKLSDPPLPANTGFKIGISLGLGDSETAVADPAACIKKPAWKTVICTQPVEWPTGISAVFNVLSRLYRGAKTIVRYESGVATQFHTLFRTDALDAVVEHFRSRYGPPIETSEQWTALFMQPSRLNRTVLWRKADAGGGGHTVLEIREIDDLRWSMTPDTKNGVIWLHREGADPIFRSLSASDLLLARILSKGK